MVDPILGRGGELLNLLRSRRGQHVLGYGAGDLLSLYLFVGYPVYAVDLCDGAVLATRSWLRVPTDNVG